MRLLLFCIISFLLMAETSFAVLKATAEMRQEYDDCGCGCCGGTKPKDQCVYKSQGESIDTIAIAAMKARPSESQCAVMGCSAGTNYHYCD